MEEHLVFFLEQGFLGVKLNNRCVRVDPGTAVWIPPGGDRELWGVKSGRFLRYHKMRFNLRKDGREIVFSNKIITRTRIWDIMPYFQLLSREVQDSQPWKEFHIRGLLSAFSVLFIRAESRRDDDSVRRSLLLVECPQALCCPGITFQEFSGILTGCLPGLILKKKESVMPQFG
jgi:hypothetical protein